MFDPDKLFFKEYLSKDLHERYFDAILESIPDNVEGICFVNALYVMGDNSIVAAIQVYENLEESKSDPMRPPYFYLKVQ